MRPHLFFTVAAIIFGAEFHVNEAIAVPAVLSIVLSTCPITSAFRLPTGQNDLLTQETSSDALHPDDRLLKTGGRGKSYGNRGSTNSRNTINGVSRGRGRAFRIAGPIGAVSVFWLYRRNTNRNGNQAPSQCFTQDAFEDALLRNTTRNAVSASDETVSSSNDTVSPINETSTSIFMNNGSGSNATNGTSLTNRTSGIIRIETSIGDPINLDDLNQQNIKDIKEAFNTAREENIVNPELCPMINAASSSKGLFVQVAVVAMNALKQVLLFF